MTQTGERGGMTGMTEAAVKGSKVTGITGMCLAAAGMTGKAASRVAVIEPGAEAAAGAEAGAEIVGGSCRCSWGTMSSNISATCWRYRQCNVSVCLMACCAACKHWCEPLDQSQPWPIATLISMARLSCSFELGHVQAFSGILGSRPVTMQVALDSVTVWPCPAPGLLCTAAVHQRPLPHRRPVLGSMFCRSGRCRCYVTHCTLVLDVVVRPLPEALRSRVTAVSGSGHM